MRAKKNSKVYPVLRGGTYYHVPWSLSTTLRVGAAPGDRVRDGSFRLVVRRKT